MWIKLKHGIKWLFMTEDQRKDLIFKETGKTQVYFTSYGARYIKREQVNALFSSCQKGETDV